MKKLLFIFLLPLFMASVKAQPLYTLQHGGLTRIYLKYIPSSYTGAQAYPLVICLHGLGDTIENFKNIGMQFVGDTADFITVYPEAVASPFGTAWNSGASYLGYVLNGTIDDVGFLSALIDTMSVHYNINPQRVYVCGFSMGGFMSQRLACQLGNKVTAIASVAGTFGNNLTCAPMRKIPVCHFHGTADTQVAYINNSYGNDPEELVDWWVNFNECDTPAVHTALPDLVADGITVDKYYYANPTYHADVLFYKATGANHQWLYPPANDIFYTFEIWNFFNPITNLAYGIETPESSDLNVYPNPASTEVNIVLGNGWNSNVDVSVYSIDGQLLMQEKVQSTTVSLNTQKLSSGLYLIKISDSKRSSMRKIVIE
ncbi:MAG: alpha/beta fold hydrolase [Bacteroidota bacterium]